MSSQIEKVWEKSTDRFEKKLGKLRKNFEFFKFEKRLVWLEIDQVALDPLFDLRERKGNIKYQKREKSNLKINFFRSNETFG